MGTGTRDGIRRLILFAAVGVLGSALLAPSCPGPVVGSRMELPGLDAAVRVSTDAFGVPHVEASNDHDAFLVQGFLHARRQDRWHAAGLRPLPGRSCHNG